MIAVLATTETLDKIVSRDYSAYNCTAVWVDGSVDPLLDGCVD